MEVILGLLPLDLQAEEIAAKARLRTRDLLSDVWDGIGNKKRGHRFYLDRTLSKITSTTLPLDHTINSAEWVMNEEVENPDVILYTDGSLLDEHAGAGWAACHGDTVVAEESIYLGKTTTVFQAEVVAIERSLIWAKENLDPGTKVVIRSDSMSAIQSILQRLTKSKVVMSCKKILKQAKENLRIGIKWIKGHADFTGNELADYLARHGSCLNVASVHPELPVPLSTVNREIKDHFEAKWQRRWDALNECRQTKFFHPKVRRGKIKKLVKLERKELNLIVQVCTGHALVSQHISKWTGNEEPCEMCLEEDETTSHLFYECPALWKKRHEIKSFEAEMEMQVWRFFSEGNLIDLFNRRSQSCRSSSLY